MSKNKHPFGRNLHGHHPYRFRITRFLVKICTTVRVCQAYVAQSRPSVTSADGNFVWIGGYVHQAANHRVATFLQISEATRLVQDSDTEMPHLAKTTYLYTFGITLLLFSFWGCSEIRSVAPPPDEQIEAAAPLTDENTPANSESTEPDSAESESPSL